jgi:hypothetical protein
MKTLQIVGTWIRDHIWLVVIAAVALVAFFFIPQFKEVSYGIFRVLIAVILVSIVLYAWFRETIRQHIVSGDFKAAFESLEAKHKVATTISVIAFITWAIVECIVHP